MNRKNPLRKGLPPVTHESLVYLVAFSGPLEVEAEVVSRREILLVARIDCIEGVTLQTDNAGIGQGQKNQADVSVVAKRLCNRALARRRRDHWVAFELSSHREQVLTTLFNFDFSRSTWSR